MKKENIKLSIIISLIVIVSLSVTYAFTELNATNSNATGEGGCFEVTYVGGDPINTSLQSTDDYTKGAQTTIKLSKDETCKIYKEATIYIYTDETNTSAPIATNNALQYQVMTGDTIVKSGTVNKYEDQELVTVALSDTETEYKIYLWINPDISQGAFNNTTYSGYIYASANQSSTITE